jgi:hypothetical protein
MRLLCCLTFSSSSTFYSPDTSTISSSETNLRELEGTCLDSAILMSSVSGPNTQEVVSTHSGYSSESSSMGGVLFGTLNTFYFQQNTSPYISHGTDTMMTHYETGGTKIP